MGRKLKRGEMERKFSLPKESPVLALFPRFSWWWWAVWGAKKVISCLDGRQSLLFPLSISLRLKDPHLLSSLYCVCSTFVSHKLMAHFGWGSPFPRAT